MRRLLLLVLLGCTGAPTRDSVVLRIAMWGPLGELSPGSGDASLASIAQPWVFEKLVTVDGAGGLVPVLAARIERRSGDSIRVELRPGATFSDGSPVTEADVVRSLESADLDVTHESGGLVVASRAPAMPADALLLQAYVYRESGGGFVGSGPFAVAGHGEKELHLVRRHPQPNRVNDVRLLAYPGPRDAFAHTLKGDANMIVDVESRWLEFFQGVPSLQIVRGGGHSTDAIVFNARLPRSERAWLAQALASRRVRELAYADAECTEAGGADPHAGEMPGASLRILSWGPFERLALAARRALGSRGGEVVQALPNDALEKVKSRNFDLVTMRPLQWPPSAIAIVWGSRSPENPSGYSNAAVDRAIETGDWAAARAALQDDPPAAFICTRQQLAVVDARIKNPRLGPYEALETLPDWEVTQ